MTVRNEGAPTVRIGKTALVVVGAACLGIAGLGAVGPGFDGGGAIAMAAVASSRLYLPDVSRADAGVGLELRRVTQVGGRLGAVVVEGRRAWAGIGPRIVAFEIDRDDRLAFAGASEVLPGLVQDLAFVDEHVYAIVRGGRFLLGRRPDEGVYAFDVSAGDDPRHVGTLTQIGSALTHIVGAPGSVFVTNDGNGAWGIDVGEPSRPRVASEAGIPSLGEGYAWNAAWHEGYLYVLHFDFRGIEEPSVTQLAVLRAPDAASLAMADTVPVADLSNNTFYGDLAVDRDRLYWLGNDPVVWSLADPARPALVRDALFGVNAGTVADGRMYAMTDLGVVVIADVTDPISVTVLGGADLGLDASRLAVDGGILFGAAGDVCGPGGGVAALDARVPSAAVRAGVCGMPGVCSRNVAVGTTGLLVPEGAGLWHWSDPAEADAGCAERAGPGMMGPHLGPIAVSGARGFVAQVGASPAGVWALDLSDPGAPRLGGRCADLPSLIDVAAEGDHAFALSVRGLHVIDGRDVDAPMLRESIELADDRDWYRPAGVAVRSGLLAVAGPKLHLFDVVGHQVPVPLSSLGPTEAHDVAVHGDLVFVSGRVSGGCVNGGLHVLDASERGAPRLVAEDCWRSAGPLAVTEAPAALGAGSLVFVGDETRWHSVSPAVWAYHVPPGGRVPVPLFTVPLPDDPRDMVVSDDGSMLWVADGEGGVFGYEVRLTGRRDRR